MDVLFLLAFAFGIVYAMVVAARWAFKIDRTRPSRERLNRREAGRINEAFDEIVKRFSGDDPK